MVVEKMIRMVDDAAEAATLAYTQLEAARGKVRFPRRAVDLLCDASLEAFRVVESLNEIKRQHDTDMETMAAELGCGEAVA